MKDGLPVHGYQPQSDDRIALVNEFKQDEERLLRKVENLERAGHEHQANIDWSTAPDMRKDFAAWKEWADTNKVPYDEHWLGVAKRHFMEGFMALNRAVFQPQRIKLPEDED